MTQRQQHQPVLLQEILQFLDPLTIKTFVDGTVGLGGHAEAILAHHAEIKRYIAIDQDHEALDLAQKRLAPWEKKTLFHHDSFFQLPSLFATHHLPKADAILLDLGVSSMQLDTKERGFSFREEGPLDMRMDVSQSQTAEDIVNTFSEKELGTIFREYGEEWRWRQAAKALVTQRKKQRIKTTQELLAALAPAIGRGRGKIHPATKIFQALRIAVNDELNGLALSLPKILDLLEEGGLCLVISFHSLEDRIVKFAFKEASSTQNSLFQLLTKKVITPSLEEERKNRRARSAKLRIIQRRSG